MWEKTFLSGFVFKFSKILGLYVWVSIWMEEVGGELEIFSKNCVRDPGKKPAFSTRSLTALHFLEGESQTYFNYNSFVFFFMRTATTLINRLGLIEHFWDDKSIRWWSQPIVSWIIKLLENTFSLPSLLFADVCALLIGITHTGFSSCASLQATSFNTKWWGEIENIHDGHDIRNQRISGLSSGL